MKRGYNEKLTSASYRCLFALVGILLFCRSDGTFESKRCYFTPLNSRRRLPKQPSLHLEKGIVASRNRHRYDEISLFRDDVITGFRNDGISGFRYFEMSLCRYYVIFLVPLHSGYPLQLQNSLPELMPFFAMRLIMGLPQTGQVGALACTLCSLR